LGDCCEQPFEKTDFEGFIKSRFVEFETIKAGASGCKKYMVRDARGQKYFVRLSPLSELIRRRFEYEVQSTNPICEALMPKLEEYGVHENMVFAVYEWVEGRTLRSALKQMTKHDRFTTGMKVGALLKDLHSVSYDVVSDDLVDEIASIMENRIRSKYGWVLDSQPRFENLGNILCGRLNLQSILKCTNISGGGVVFTHGDLQASNLIFCGTKIVAIDFEVSGVSSPWQDLGIMLCRALFECESDLSYAAGCLFGYTQEKIELQKHELVQHMILESLNILLYIYNYHRIGTDGTEKALKALDKIFSVNKFLLDASDNFEVFENAMQNEIRHHLMLMEHDKYDLFEQLQQAQIRVKQLETSTCWRITKPLRVIINAARAVAGLHK